MSNTIAYVDNQTLTNIADAVRYKTGTNEKMLLSDIPDTIRNLDTSDITALDERVTALESGSGSGLTADVKSALLACFQNVAWVGDDGQDFYDALDAALNPPTNLSSITCVYTQSGTVYDTASLDELKPDLVVTAHYDNNTSQVITAYTLSGTLAVGTSTITVSYGGKTTTFTVTVTEAPPEEELWIDGLSTGSTARFGYSPFVLPAETYSYDYSKAITSIEGSFTATGSLSIGYYTGSYAVGTAIDTTSVVIHETLTISATGQQKITLSEPMSIPSGAVMLIGQTTDTATFSYGGSLTNGFMYVDYANGRKLKAQSKKLGFNVYRI